MFKSKRLPAFIVSLMVVILFASACSAQKAQAGVIGITWQWVGMVETKPASQSVVPTPENYTLILETDGSLNIKADCNRVNGSYTIGSSTLTIELGASTMAFCGEQSVDQKFLESLRNVASYTIENDQLVLILKNDAGKMTFNK
jgi:heat shock protein HslJ